MSYNTISTCVVDIGFEVMDIAKYLVIYSSIFHWDKIIVAAVGNSNWEILSD